jgi:hypothetical protein
MTAFTNRLVTILPGFGTCQQNDTNQLLNNTSLSGTAQQTTSLTGITPTISRGYFRMRVSTGGGTSPTLTDVIVQVTDGTTTTTVYVFHPNTALALSANIQFDVTIPLLVDINVSQVNVLTTMGGTSPTSKLDMEIAGAI